MQTKRTVFQYEELHKIFQLPSKKALDQFLFRAKKDGDLFNPTRGIRTLPVFDNHELACALKQESYISLESVLYDVGAIFQAYFNTTTCVANQGGSFTIEGKKYTYAKIKNDILHNTLGIKEYDNYRMAMPERALCDYIYLYPSARLDNPQIFSSPAQIVRIEKFLPLYPQQTQLHVRKLLGLPTKNI